MVHQNSNLVSVIRAFYSQGFNPGLQEDENEWTEVGEGGKPKENGQEMMEEDKKQGEKWKLPVKTNDKGTKGSEIKTTTIVKDTMRARGENMLETKMIYESKLQIEFNVKNRVEQFNIRRKMEMRNGKMKKPSHLTKRSRLSSVYKKKIHQKGNQ
eukprot:1719143-Ditylum_brightwellii.AAC.1